ncbi:MAG: M28 family metallopeptidase [Candidatus Acidiferrales bacterium]
MFRRRAMDTKLSALSIILAALLLPAYLTSQEKPLAPILGFSPAHTDAERQLETRLRAIPDAAHAEANLRHLTAEPHMAGTEASRRVAEWLRDQYRSFGFDAEIVTYTAWFPLPRIVELELIAPKRARLASPEPPIPGDKDTYDKRAVIGFNTYSPSGEVTAPVVYVNYGMPDDYRELDTLGVSVEGKIVLARYGRGYRGIKAKLAEEHKARALILYSDPQDDGFVAGDPYPHGPWRPMGGIQRGSVLYTQIYPGDPLAPGAASTPDANVKRLAPSDAANLPRIPTMPISAKDAAVILSALGGPPAPRGWQGGLPLTYHVGPGKAEAHMKVVMDFAERPVYDVIATLHGSSDDEWVVLGNHHDAWVFGAADPGSGTASMLEAARALGELVRSGWKPRRTIVMCAWDAEEPGLVGSTAWVEANLAALQAHAVAYINTDVGVTGPNFSASATPSLKNLVRDATRDVPDPGTGGSVYKAWLVHDTRADRMVSPEAPLGALGAGSDFCPFFDYAGIPSMDIGFDGDYGVYHSLYDDFSWMNKFGDPTFAYHAALARVLGTLALRLDEADLLPFDYAAYASEIARAADALASRAANQEAQAAILKPVLDASAEFSASAARASHALAAISSQSLDPAKEQQINRALAGVEQALLSPEGLAGRPWFKHTVYAPGSYSGYAAEIMPGVSEALDRGDLQVLQREADSLAAALRRAALRLDDVARLAQQAASSPAAN